MDGIKIDKKLYKELKKLFNFSRKEMRFFGFKPGIHIDSIIKDGHTPLTLVVDAGNVKAVDLLIAAGANVNRESFFNGNTAVIFAASHYSEESGCYQQIAERLISAGADVNKTNHDNETALACAALYRNAEMVDILIKSKADLFVKDRYGKTASMIATGYGKDHKTAQLLIKAEEKENKVSKTLSDLVVSNSEKKKSTKKTNDFSK